ncbi:MucR family transcriptional regulator, partial [Serratia sp. DD3]|uniref:MucR family transcriptional regulator n=1 Tax=Serratia sp. DD3 TaxID=1410619 RepID=UPI000563D3DA
MTEPLPPRNTTHRFLPRELHPAVNALLAYLTEGPFAPPEKCPWCGSLRFNGGGNKQQRYWCKQCQRSFFPTSGTPFSNCRHPEKWTVYAHYRLAGYASLQASQLSGLTTHSGLHREAAITQILSERWPQLLPWWQGRQHQTQCENPLRTTPFTSKEEAWAHHNHEYVQCLECGKMFSFLATHLRKAHGITAQTYREKWQIMKQIP